MEECRVCWAVCRRIEPENPSRTHWVLGPRLRRLGWATKASTAPPKAGQASPLALWIPLAHSLIHAASRESWAISSTMFNNVPTSAITQLSLHNSRCTTIALRLGVCCTPDNTLLLISAIVPVESRPDSNVDRHGVWNAVRRARRRHMSCFQCLEHVSSRDMCVT